MRRIRNVFILLATAGLVGCGSTPIEDHYYSLVLAAGDSASSQTTDSPARELIVGPVTLPDYLDHRGISLQTGPNKIQSASHNFWAEPLDEAINKVLVQDIAKSSSELSVTRHLGRQSTAAVCRLGIEFDKFHATDDGAVVSSGRYWLSNDEGRIHREFSLRRKLRADGYAHAVNELRETLRSVAALVRASIDASTTCAPAG